MSCTDTADVYLSHSEESDKSGQEQQTKLKVVTLDYSAAACLTNGAVSIMDEKIIIEEPLHLRTYIISIKQTSDIFKELGPEKKHYFLIA